ncbi:Retrovirus-related Pol polyprotein [Thelohanellus kitauei]|uniref:Retrovirus-related Pol polyprotein n=1 Tax=Thelohanellus kitauei TaxID=669202 RepID=A0A0C2M7R6_THEKT|nr:Retrovirus-related Pol polyprotein [Thelohanellus kitauei]
MRDDVINWTKSCVECSVYNDPTAYTKALLKQINTSKRNEILGMDIVGPLPVARGYKYILTIIDRFTKWLSAIPLKETDGLTIADAFIHNYVYIFDIPEAILTDQGKNFKESTVLSMAERVAPITHKEMGSRNEQIKQFYKYDDWPKTLKALCFAYNTSKIDTTGVSPYESIFKKSPTIPIDLMFGWLKTHNIWAERERLSKEFNTVGEIIRKSREHQKKYYDVKLHDPPFSVGDKVYVQYPKKESIDKGRKFARIGKDHSR